ncbi:MAG: hypothetical protein ABH863_04350 [Candidatus Micrarchaeota archaeon]
MWRVVAIFLLLLILTAVSALRREGFYWMIAVFSSFLAVGIFIYITYVFRMNREHRNSAKEIKNAIGKPTFAYKIGSNESASDEPEKVIIGEEGKAKSEGKGTSYELGYDDGENAVPIKAVKVDTPKITLPDKPGAAPQNNEIHAPAIELPDTGGLIIATLEVKPISNEAEKDGSNRSATPPFEDLEKPKEQAASDKSDVNKMDLAALRAKIKKDQDEGR